MSNNSDDNDYGDYGGYDDNNYDEFEEEKEIMGEITLTKKKSIVFVTLTDIKQIIKEKCKEINEVLGTSDDEALIILNYFQWRKDLVENEWFGNESAVSKKAGIEPVEIVPLIKTPTIQCPMCFDQKSKIEFDALKCNHQICRDCWRDYISFNITRPENIFFWKCPFQGCNLVIPETFNLQYTSNTIIPQYNKKMGVAYSDNSKSMRWCPSPGCEYGVEVASLSATGISCPCGWMYCFKCGIEDHRPCDCEIAKEWTKKDEGGGANAKWLLINTKDCPKCKRPIEKNQGCNFMKCRHGGCQYEFCWLCSADWKTHNDHFKCNKYDNLSKEEKASMDDETNKQRSELQKFAFYYERFGNNNIAIQHINKIMKAIQHEQKDIAINLMLTLSQLEFLNEACQVLRNSKRILKWSYAYGYYLANDLQRNLYEIIQENLDMYSSELHVLLEKKYEEAKMSLGEFTKFRQAVQSSVFKSKQSSEAFLEKMEEFENIMLEDQVRNNSSDANTILETKEKKTVKSSGSGLSKRLVSK